MSFEFVRDVDREADKKEYLEEKARLERRVAMLHPPKVETLKDFKKVYESLLKYDQKPELLKCGKGWEETWEDDFQDPETCILYGMNALSVDREKEKVKVEVNHNDIEKKFLLELNNVLDVEVRRPTSMTDVIYERRHGGDTPPKKYPDYWTDIYDDRGKCNIHWEGRGPYRSPKEGFEIHCTEMTADELLEKFRDRIEGRARYRLKKLPGEEITEEELKRVAENIVAEEKQCKSIFEE